MIPAEKTDLWVGSISSSTKDMPYNQDSYAIVSFQPSSDGQPVSTLAVVADGWSSSQARQDGKMASQLTVNAIVETFSQAESVKVQELCKGFEAASKSITQYSAGRTEREGIGATCVAVLVMNRRLYAASLGDCRAFLLREHRIQQISVADSFVDKLIEQGVITYEELRKTCNV